MAIEVFLGPTNYFFFWVVIFSFV